MKCDEVQTLHNPYLDSELDARTTLEIERHLKSCPECARCFDEAQKLEGRIKAGLSQGHRTAALWAQIERSVVTAALSIDRAQPALGTPRPAGWHAVLLALGEQLQAGWGRSPRVWSGLAVAWVAILVLNFTAREPVTPLLAGQEVPSVSEMRSAWKQKQVLMAELAVLSEPAPADKVKRVAPGPRSEGHQETLST
jgi:anti-sigma factor RsiW